MTALLDWQSDGLCAQTDPVLFFPDPGSQARPAKQICHGCPVRPECLHHALTNGERYGVWGVTSERERRRLTTPTTTTAGGPS
ncbi:WhiB family transcriptional regulator [Streptomyces vinaceus]|uniref:WhiB family transcriptional regulator n=1 Tax=Streptomyces vinaceus TaxID=1960 RepID=UPI0036B9BD71